MQLQSEYYIDVYKLFSLTFTMGFTYTSSMQESNIILIEKACEEVFRENGLNSIETDAASVSFDSTILLLQ